MWNVTDDEEGIFDPGRRNIDIRNLCYIFFWDVKTVSKITYLFYVILNHC